MPGAVFRPWHGLEPFLVDGLIVFEASTVRAVGDSSKRKPHIVQDAGVGFVFGEELLFLLVLNAVITYIAGRAVSRLPLLGSGAGAPRNQFPFLGQQK